MSNPAQGTSVPSIFQFDSQEIRTLLIDEQPWFVAADVCAVLGDRNAPDTRRPTAYLKAAQRR